MIQVCVLKLCWHVWRHTSSIFSPCSLPPRSRTDSGGPSRSDFVQQLFQLLCPGVYRWGLLWEGDQMPKSGNKRDCGCKNPQQGQWHRERGVFFSSFSSYSVKLIVRTCLGFITVSFSGIVIFFAAFQRKHFKLYNVNVCIFLCKNDLIHKS